MLESKIAQAQMDRIDAIVQGLMLSICSLRRRSFVRGGSLDLTGDIEVLEAALGVLKAEYQYYLKQL